MTETATRRSLPAPRNLSALPDWSEGQLANLCNELGVTNNKAVQDRKGWDYILEWDADQGDVPVDRRSAARCARVQVKSNREKTPTIKLNLLNALRFCQNLEPCFVVLFWLRPDASGVEVFCKHFDEGIITRILKRAREADAAGTTDLHKIDMTFVCTDDDLHTGDVVEWIQSVSKKLPADYSMWKHNLFENVGYENGRLHATISFPLADMNSFADHAVGLPAEFKPQWLELKDVRFEIPARTPTFSGVPDHFSMVAKPTPARVEFRDPTDDKVAAFDGQMRNIEIRGMPDSWTGSFTSKHFSLRIGSDRQISLNFSYASEEVLAVHELHNCVTMLTFFNKTLKMTMHAAKQSIDLDIPRMTMSDVDTDFAEWSETTVRYLKSVVRPADKPILSLSDILEKEEDAELFGSLLLPQDMMLEFDGGYPEALPTVQNLIGYLYVEIGDSTFAAVMRRPCISQKRDEKTFQTVFGPPVILERWARKGNLAEHLPRVKRAYERAKKRSAGPIISATDGDMMKLAKSGTEVLVAP